MMISFAPNRVAGIAPVQVFWGPAFLSGTYSASAGVVDGTPILEICTIGQYVNSLTSSGQYVSSLTSTGQYVNSLTSTGEVGVC